MAIKLCDLIWLFTLPSNQPDAEERLRFLFDIKPRIEKGEEIIVFKDNGLWVRLDEVVDLQGCKKNKNEFLPYYDIAAMRSAYGNPDYKWRTDFRFTKDITVEIRDGRPYLDSGALSEPNDLLLSTQGTLGETFTTPERCYVTESLKLVKFKYNLFLPDFFALFIESKKEEILKANQSQMIPSLNRTAFNKMMIPLHPMAYQEYVVAECNLTKDYIKQLEQHIEENKKTFSYVSNELLDFKEIENNDTESV